MEASQELTRPRRKAKGNKNRRLRTERKTTVKNLGLASQTVRVSMKDVDNDFECNDSDESTSSKSEETSYQHTASIVRSLLGKKNRRKDGPDGIYHGTKRKRGRARRRRKDVINSSEAPRMIVDPGTEIDVIRGGRWFIMNVVDGTTANLGGALTGMGERRLPIVSAVTEYDHETEGPILIGHEQVAWDDRPEQIECLINSYSLRHNDVTVDNVTRRDGGKQKITINGTEVKLDFVDEKTQSLNIRKPTKNELITLKILWLSPKQCNPFKEKDRTPRNHWAPSDYVKTPTSWEDRLACPPEMIATKTHENTTQLCSSAVEMKNLESPRQHRKK